MRNKIKKAHRFADIEIFKANLKQRFNFYKDWLKADANKVKNWQVLLLLGIVVYNVVSFFIPS